ncbi:Nitroreductase [Paenibacillus sophorae]|uniref:Nitroreductase n=1 Tax=Paenibacillus sophorae TaxID=1333845 RepID=A0A1H8TVB2_9BACL|nr:nitroreductase family protein [Paenibacillus sophorae]QWU18052.1 nitroreductase family protein [Paenibacillus sophorae]SEO94942.1 Nitroreductase [Paenibacillus sophorae]
MIFDDFKQLAQSRRSIRDFSEEDVLPEDVRDIIDCARFAPSDTNSQTWEFIAVMNRDKIKVIEAFTWDRLKEIAASAEQRGLAREAKLMVKSFGPYATAFGSAPAMIICLATPYTSKFRERIFDPLEFGSPEIWAEEGIKSSCLSIQNLMLAAHAKGLGTCPMTGPVLLAEQDLRKYLNIPEDRQINMAVALGHPAVQPKMIARKEIEEILTIVE